MAAMTKNQKKATRNYMLEYMGKESGVVPKTLIMKTVTYLPWANRHHVCGTLKALEMNGSIKRKEGLLY